MSTKTLFFYTVFPALAAALLFSTYLPARAASHAGKAVNIVFILDGSGSMWGEIEGTDKIAIAKEVMTNLIQDMPKNSNIGLVAYGHRRKGDCQDVEELVPVAPLNKDKLIKTIQAINPRGKTPITRSVRVTAEKIKALDDEVSIILVSDGKETCDEDPCDLIKELKKQGLRFTMHVIGFDVTKEELTQLECMAREGGGKYFTAKSADELDKAIKDMVQETQTVGFLEVAALRNNQPVSALVEVKDVKSGKTMKRARTSTNANKPAVIRLKPGEYTIVFTDTSLAGNPEQPFSNVRIQLAQSVRKTAEFKAGTLEVAALKDGNKIKALVHIYQEKDLVDQGWLEKGRTRSFALSPGTYQVKLTDKSIPDEPHVIIPDIKIQSGKTVTETANFSQEGRLKIEAFKGSKSIHVLSKVYQGEKQVHSKWLEEGKGATYKLLSGTYRVVLVDKSIPQEPEVLLDDIKIQSGKTTDKQAEFTQEGSLKIEAFKGNKSIHVLSKVYQGEDRIHSKWLEEGKGVTYKLLPGTYRVELEDKSIPQEPEVLLDDIKIQSGKTTDKQAEFTQEGSLKVEAFKEGNSLHVVARIYKGNDRIVSGWLDKGKGKIFKLLPGSYTVKISGPDKETREKSKITIQSGKTTTVNIHF